MLSKVKKLCLCFLPLFLGYLFLQNTLNIEEPLAVSTGKSMDMGDLGLAQQLTGILGKLTGSLGGITSLDAAQAALPALEAVYTGGQCQHNRLLCQYELEKAIELCGGSPDLLKKSKP